MPLALLTLAPALIITDTPGTLATRELVALLSHLGESLVLYLSFGQAYVGFSRPYAFLT